LTVFGPIFVPAELSRATSDSAWLAAMLDAERALAGAQARLGIVPSQAATAIAERCRPELFDIDDLCERGRGAGNPVEPLVRALRERVGGDGADYVHWGATSQDILDTAAMLVARRALEIIVRELDGAAAATAALADGHAGTMMVARTLLQQASPSTFGYKAAGWLSAVLDARQALLRVRDERLAAQLGGAVGTLAAFGDRGVELLAAFSDEAGLANPVLPWHADRTRIAELGAALELVAGALSKIALDVVLLAQTEVAEVREGDGGVSSTLPHKRNPVRATRTIACARGAGAAASLLRSGRHEHERAAGAWHAEWPALSNALSLTGGAAWAARELLEALQVDADRMRENLDRSQGLVMAERLVFLLSPKLGRKAAHELVAGAAARLATDGGSLRDALAADESVDLSPAELDAAFDPSGYLGSAPALVAAVLSRYRSVFERVP
jgi:3-carboxy-cis,cis-muconate cycloisomerase